ncbi:MAG: SDR family NAD(P)-dependent oxidoreductase [Verrucomicrobiales bacterium]|nr:SDR family NAD(P)-dependent oxidoreductase [Verrucomicrobiales bacterium]
MDTGLSGKKVIVFGGASGIGQAVVRAFRSEEAEVFVADLEPGDETSSAKVDISDLAEVTTVVNQIGDKQGGIDHVVCAAAKGSGKFGFPFWNLEPGDWKSVLEVSLIGSVNVAHACQPWLCEGGNDGKTLLYFTSVAGQIGSQTDPPYSAAKAGVINFTQCAAKDFAAYGVRVNALSPGMVKTDLNESVWASSQQGIPEENRLSYEDWADLKIKSIAPLARWQEPEEFGAMAVYLASFHAKNITGQIINIDGGQVMKG